MTVPLLYPKKRSVIILTWYQFHVRQGTEGMYFGRCVVLQGHNELERSVPIHDSDMQSIAFHLRAVNGDSELLSEGSALLNSPSSFSAIFDPVTDPLKPDSFRTRIIVSASFVEHPVPRSGKCLCGIRGSGVCVSGDFFFELLREHSPISLIASRVSRFRRVPHTVLGYDEPRDIY